ncbi:MAG: hypothetical protein GWP08_10300 [Nitrospiraceae bacterium]|nr:hypothetical protein [Nitrospiraceae bacterium]
MSQLTRIGLAAALILGALPMAHADGESSCIANGGQLSYTTQGAQKVAAIEAILSAACRDEAIELALAQLDSELRALRSEALFEPAVVQAYTPASNRIDRLVRQLAAARQVPRRQFARRAAQPRLIESVPASDFGLEGMSLSRFAAVEENGVEEIDAEDVEAATPDAGPEPPAKREGSRVMKRMKQVLGKTSGEEAEAAVTPVAPTVEAPAPAVEPTPALAPLEAPAPAPAPAAPPAPPVFVGDPMQQIVDIEFREMELTNVVALLAQKAQINVIAGEDLSGVVTANLRNVTLRQAIDTALRMNGLGMIEEEGIYHIVKYDEAIDARRITRMVKLENAKVDDLLKTLTDILRGSRDDTLMSFSSNPETNVLLIAGPEARVEEFVQLAQNLDIAKPVALTVTEAIKLNNAEPMDLEDMVKGMLTPEIGQVAFDIRTRHIVVTDMPIVIEQVRALIAQIDFPVRQVCIDTMVVDAILSDDSQTGIDWLIKAVQKTNKRGVTRGSLENLGSETDATGGRITPGAISNIALAQSITFGMLTGDFDFRGAIAAEVSTSDAKLLANPVVVTVENKEARINISQEIPYQELTQSTTGPPMSSTAFKDVGIVLTVTPRVTHDDHIISDVSIKQSDTKGEVNNIPIEDKRETETTLRTKNGQTVFIGGLRRFDDELQTKKIPVLGDIPVVNFLFRSNIVRKESTELLIFLTCSILPEEMPGLTPDLQAAHDELAGTSKVPDSQADLWKSIAKPKTLIRDPAWKWRRSE